MQLDSVHGDVVHTAQHKPQLFKQYQPEKTVVFKIIHFKKRGGNRCTFINKTKQKMSG